MTSYWVLGSLLLLLALLIHGRISPAILFMALAGAFHLCGLIDEQAMLASYTNPALATLVVLLLVSLALERSPLMDRVSSALFTGSLGVVTFRLAGLATLFSAFLNNTAVVGTLLGTVTKQRRFPASKLLLPLSYASIFGGVTTLVGTSTNLVVNSFVVGAGLAPLEMFQFSWVGVPVALLCVVVLAIISRWLPSNEGGALQDGTAAYFLEAQLSAGSSLAGKTIDENKLRNLEGLFLFEIVRGGRLISPVAPDELLEEGDLLIFSGEVERVQTLQKFSGLRVFGTSADDVLRSNLVEVVVSSESELANRTLREVDFRTMFDAAVVGIRRGNRRLTGQLGRIPLHVGDSLLLAVGSDFTQHRNIDRNFHLVGNSIVRPRLTRNENLLTLGGFSTAILLSALGLVPLFASLLVCLGGLIAMRVLTISEMRRRFPFELLLIIGSALTIAKVLESSGAAALIANGMKAVLNDFGVWGASVGVYLLTLVLTELITNNAAAALAFPIALSTARAFGADPLPFVMLVAYGASACFMFPFGYQTHLMVYSPGRYRLQDFIRAGLPVSVAYSLGVLLLVPYFFPF